MATREDITGSLVVLKGTDSSALSRRRAILPVSGSLL